MSCTIIDLINNPFSLRSHPEKVAIVTKGRPVPDLPKLCYSSNSGRNRDFTRHFSTRSYAKHSWLTGSVELNALFCWNCLLFGEDRNTSWTKSGFIHLGNFVRSTAGHEVTIGHMRSSVALGSFDFMKVEMQIEEDDNIDISAHNQTVKCNRLLLKRLINAVCFLGKQELFCGERDNLGNLVELLKYTSEYDPLSAHLENSTVFNGITDTIQRDVIDAVASALLAAIKTEIEAAKVVSVLIDQTYDVSHEAQFSIVLRYAHDGQVKERFVGFCDLGADRHATAIAELINEFLTELCCNEKVISQSYDGAALLAGNLNEIQSLIKNNHPEALFVHSYTHDLNLVLSQSVRCIPECKVFFSTLSGIGKFFTGSPNRTRFLDSFLAQKLPNVSPTTWNYKSWLVNTVCTNKLQLCEVFATILNNPDQIEEDILSPVKGFISALEDFTFCFYLNTFDKIFTHVDVLFTVLQQRSFDIVEIAETRHNIASLRSEYDNIFDETVSQVGDQSFMGRDKHFKQVFYDIFDNIDTHLQTRFQDYEKLQFLYLLSSEMFGDYRNAFPKGALSTLIEIYNKHLQRPRLKNELIVLYSTDTFANKSPVELLRILNASPTLASTFEQTKVLAEIICTIPVSSAQSSSSMIERVKSYALGTSGEKRTSSLAMISIEAALLQELKNKEAFFEKVVYFFATAERQSEFTFR